jgi:hypothetical protein
VFRARMPVCSTPNPPIRVNGGTTLISSRARKPRLS